MKKISIKGIRVSSQNRRKDQLSQGEEGEVLNRKNDNLLGQKKPSQSQLCQQTTSSSHHCSVQNPYNASRLSVDTDILDSPIGLQTLDLSAEPSVHSHNLNQNKCNCHGSQGTLKNMSNGSNRCLNEVPHQRKRERMGLFRNLRRKISSLRRTEGAECNSHLDNNHLPANLNINMSPNVSSCGAKNKHHFWSTATSQSCDSLNRPLKQSHKVKEWHANTNDCWRSNNIEEVKNKPGCLSKDMSHFKSVPSSSNCLEEGVHEKKCNTDRTNYANKDTDKNTTSEPCYELADCVEYDPIKEQTTIWSPKVWSLTQELFRLSKFGWYWGPLRRNEAEEKLTNEPDGAFLVRDSSDERYLLSLSFRSYGRTLHTRIEHCNGVFSFYAQPDSEGYHSIVDLIEHSMNESQTGIFYYSRSQLPGAPQIPVVLTKPVSRFTQVRSLQYLCRFVIRENTRYDLIQKLPLPTTLKGWIEENQY